MRPLASILALAVLAASSAFAQEPRKKVAPAPEEPPVLNWEVSLGGAGGFGSSASDIEAAMRSAGYGQASYPSSSGDFLSATFFPSVRFRFGGQFAVGLSGSSTKLGSTTGYGYSTLVTVQRSSADVAAVFFWRPVPGVRLGAGPAWYRLTATPDGQSDLTDSHIGWLAEAGVAFPETGRFYADLGVQYRGTGRADFGTYQPPAYGGATPGPLELNGISCEHWAFVVGVGFRF